MHENLRHARPLCREKRFFPLSLSFHPCPLFLLFLTRLLSFFFSLSIFQSIYISFFPSLCRSCASNHRTKAFLFLSLSPTLCLCLSLFGFRPLYPPTEYLFKKKTQLNICSNKYVSLNISSANSFVSMQKYTPCAYMTHAHVAYMRFIEIFLYSELFKLPWNSIWIVFWGSFRMIWVYLTMARFDGNIWKFASTLDDIRFLVYFHIGCSENEKKTIKNVLKLSLISDYILVGVN